MDFNSKSEEKYANECDILERNIYFRFYVFSCVSLFYKDFIRLFLINLHEFVILFLCLWNERFSDVILEKVCDSYCLMVGNCRRMLLDRRRRLL